MTEKCAKANVLGVGVNAIDMQQAVAHIEAAVEERRRGYVCVQGVHGIMEAQRDRKLASVFNRALLVTPDGMPTVWVGRLQGHARMRRVFGPDLMLEVCRRSVQKGYTHFLYGGQPGVVEQLRTNLLRIFPGINIVGTYTPPFRPLSGEEQAALVRLISETRPDIMWVGISTPKQDHFMAEFIDRLEVTVMIGVGAAFDMHTGRIADAPRWMKQAGLQWLHRFGQEPRRLWKRYLVSIPGFLLLISLQFAGLKRYTTTE